MAGLTEAQKRSFARQISEIMKDSSPELKKNGVDLGAKIKEIQQKIEKSEKTEQEQLKAQAEAKAKTSASKEALKDVYTFASAQVEVIVGTFGKKHPISEKIKNIRDAMANEAARGKKKEPKKTS